MKNLIKKCYRETAPQTGRGIKFALNVAAEQQAGISRAGIFVYLITDMMKDAHS